MSAAGLSDRAGFPVHDPALAAILSTHRPIGQEESLLSNKGAFAATPDGLSGWVQHAGAGRVCVFARAEHVPTLVGKASRVLEARGLVTLRRCRNAARRDLFDFMARRTDLPFAKARPAPCEEALPPEAKLLLGTLTQMADARAPLLGNRELAAIIGMKNADSIGNVLTRLKRAGLIAVDFDAGTGRRAIEIVDTGAVTVSAGAPA